MRHALRQLQFLLGSQQWIRPDLFQVLFHRVINRPGSTLFLFLLLHKILFLFQVELLEQFSIQIEIARSARRSFAPLPFPERSRLITIRVHSPTINTIRPGRICNHSCYSFFTHDYAVILQTASIP